MINDVTLRSRSTRFDIVRNKSAGDSCFGRSNVSRTRARFCLMHIALSAYTLQNRIVYMWYVCNILWIALVVRMTGGTCIVCNLVLSPGDLFPGSCIA